MKSFDDIQYQRVDISAVKACIKESCAMLKKAARFSDVKQAVLKNSQCEGKLDTMFLVAGIRREMQPGGAFYEMELEFYLREIPRLAKLQEKFAQGILDSRYLVEIEKEFGEGYVREKKAEWLMRNKKILHDHFFENELAHKYKSMSHESKTRIRETGEKSSTGELEKKMMSPSRAEREASYKELNALLVREFERYVIFDEKFIEVREKTAGKLGYENYIEYASALNCIEHIPRGDIRKLRDDIVRYLVPEVAELQKKHCRRNGTDAIPYYDENYLLARENKKICANSRELLDLMKSFFFSVEKELKEFYRFMEERKLFRVVVDEQTYPSVRTVYLPDLHMPVLYGSINGTLADISMVFHDLGEAMRCWKSLEKSPDLMKIPGKIRKEIYSLFMEFLSVEYAAGIFGKSAEVYRDITLMNLMTSLLYYTLLDEYHEYVYSGGGHGPSERCRKWKSLEETYMPWRDYRGGEFFESGGGWAYDSRAVLYPFQHIQYVISGLRSLMLLGKWKTDPSSALEEMWDIDDSCSISEEDVMGAALLLRSYL